MIREARRLLLRRAALCSARAAPHMAEAILNASRAVISSRTQNR